MSLDRMQGLQVAEFCFDINVYINILINDRFYYKIPALEN